MNIKLINIKVYRSNFDVVMAEYINPITGLVTLTSLGIYTTGEQQKFFEDNGIEIIDNSNEDEYDNRSTTNSRECDNYPEYGDYDEGYGTV